MYQDSHKKSAYKNAYRRNEIMKDLYRKLDSFQCQGKCFSTCGKVAFNKTEYEKITEKKHELIDYFEHKQDLERSDFYHNLKPGNELPKHLRCWYLDEDGRNCTIYNERPFVCRVFGAVDTPRLRCQFGCKPTVTEDEYWEMMQVYAQVTDCDGTPIKNKVGS